MFDAELSIFYLGLYKSWALFQILNKTNIKSKAVSKQDGFDEIDKYETQSMRWCKLTAQNLIL